MYLLEVMLPSNFQNFNSNAWELKSRVTAKFTTELNRKDYISTPNLCDKLRVDI